MFKFTTVYIAIATVTLDALQCNKCHRIIVFTDVISGETYVISVVTVNELTGVVPDEQFSTIAATMSVTVPGGSTGFPVSTAIIIGVSVFILIIIATIVILFIQIVLKR